MFWEKKITKFVSPWQNTNRTFFFSRKLSKTDPASSSHLDVKKRMWISTSLKYPETAHWWFPQQGKDSKVRCFLCAPGTTVWFVRLEFVSKNLHGPIFGRKNLSTENAIYSENESLLIRICVVFWKKITHLTKSFTRLPVAAVATNFKSVICMGW